MALLAELRAALQGGPPVLPGDVGPVPEGTALVVETSGSSGAPKRIALSASALLANARATESALGRGRWILTLPTRYIAGINVLIRSIVAEEEPIEARTAGEIREAIRQGATHIALVPAQLSDLLAAGAPLDLLGAVLVGGQSTPEELVRRARAAGVNVVRSYGSSETCGGVVYDGVPIGGTRVRIEDGEVWLGGPSLALGYLDPALTAERFVERDGARWFRTADAGELRVGRLTVTGRRDDVIISGGVKVSLGAVERAVQAVYPDAVVVGGAHEHWGEHPVAFTASAEDRDAEAVALAAELGPAARPEIVHLERIPLLPSGKPDRRALAGG